MAATAPRELRRAVRDGARVCGTFAKLPGPEGIDLALAAGFDFAVADLEHSQLAESDAAALARHGAAIGLPVVVRLPSVDAASINRLLEAGAAGIQLSTLRSVEQARSLIAATRYAPAGNRSVSVAQPAAGYGAVPLTDYLAAEAADPPLVVGQVETASTDDSLDALAATGLDVLFVGVTDLSVDLGLAGRSCAPQLEARVAEVAAAAARAGIGFGGFAAAEADLGLLAGASSRYLASSHAPGSSPSAGSSPSGGGRSQGGAFYLVAGSDLQAMRHGLAAIAGFAVPVPASGDPRPPGTARSAATAGGERP